MANRFVSMKNLRFILHEVLNVESLSELPAFSGHTRKSIDMVLSAAHDFAKGELHPIFEEMDRNPPALRDGVVSVHPGVRNILRTLGDDGWISAGFPEAWGGEGMPETLLHAFGFIFAAANYSASVYAGLSAGAARLILSFGSEALKKAYVPPLLSGRWQGTMALTEPEAGSSLGDITTLAEPADNGSYVIRGRKIFISAGDHDGADNVVHLMLARIRDAPAGVKGISLFVVPKLIPDADGKPVSNHVTVTQIFHKLGYRGAPITELSLGENGDCHGFLVGEANRGLGYMFQMMNGARLEVGMGAAAIATAAYHAALEYTRSRCQGRRLTDKSSAKPIPIIRHPDVKRMLLFQRAVAEGALCLVLQCGLYEDQMAALPAEEREDLHLLTELLTPVAKSYPSEMGILATSQSLQCFGGYGYCEDFPVEQHFRDMRIHAIHEGTTGIQGMDLLGRKVMMKGGRALMLLGAEIEKTTMAARDFPELSGMANRLAETVGRLATVTQTLGALGMEKGPEALLADATLYLECFGIVTIAWQWLMQAVAACRGLSAEKAGREQIAFYEGKVLVCRYFFAYELPKTEGLFRRLTDTEGITLEAELKHFTD
ncbi:acyl-CoA dehydrogenase [Desulfonema ishimotonii]|uniref:Acyl-CoA dehydrogenase n=1 Tax=Desulfonema ishimotonii TaxID=45657 RepID=A0A401FW31_9BACT|nr:acyl-CoA dehydrogenase [Desulfonema ishimotonii]GBC61175.1 acyl-CoA dehydrogenase [Desulfonema ishimotonii]